MKLKNKTNKGITLVALVITIIILLILAGVTIVSISGKNGLLNKVNDASELTKRKSVEEKLQMMLEGYLIEKYTESKTLEQYLNEQKEKGELEEVTNNNDGTFKLEVDGYEVTIKEEDLSIVNIEKLGGVKPIFEVKETKIDGTEIEGYETERAITINIINVSEYGKNYTIEVKDKAGNIITKEENVVEGLKGQASFKITKEGDYTIKVTGTKDGIIRTEIEVITIEISMPTIEESSMFSKANGVIDIVWIDEDNNVISEPISPAGYLGGLTAITYNGTNWITADTSNSENSWYHYEAQTGTTDGKTSNWANARTSDENAYFVWIPRYAYKITYFDTLENANAYRADSNSTTGIIGYSTIDGLIDVSSGTEKLVQGSEPANVDVTKPVKSTKYAKYIPHPAFEFDGNKARNLGRKI